MTRYRRWPSYRAWLRGKRSMYGMSIRKIPQRAITDYEVRQMFGSGVLQELQSWRRLHP